MNIDIILSSTNYNNLSVTKEVDKEGINVLVNSKDSTDAYSTKRLGSSTISNNNLTFNSNVSLSKL